MPVDVSANDWLQGIGMGLQIGQARLRNKQASANEARQQIQDRLTTLQVEEHAVKLQEINEEIKKRAAEEAEWKFTSYKVADAPPEVRQQTMLNLAPTNRFAQQALKDGLTAAQTKYQNERSTGGRQENLIALIQQYEALGDTEKVAMLTATLNSDRAQQQNRSIALEQGAARIQHKSAQDAVRNALSAAGINKGIITTALTALDKGFTIAPGTPGMQPVAVPGQGPAAAAPAAPVPDAATQGWRGEGAAPAAPAAAPATPNSFLIPTERPLTTATTTQLQQSNIKLEDSLAQVAYAIKQIELHPEAFGPSGWVGEWKERVQGMFDPNAPMPITGARTSAGAAAHHLIVSLRVDSQVSNFERNALDEVVGKPSEFWTSPGHIKEKFRVLNEIAAARRIRQGKALHQPPNPADLDKITDSAHIKSMVREGTLTKEEGIAWARAHLPTQ